MSARGRTKDTKFWGGVLLLTGTAIGGGLLALPMAASEAGFGWSLLLLVACWFLMTASALVLLEVNLWLPAESNLVSMAQKLLGRWGAGVAWLSYLLLFYSVIAAFMAGGGDFLRGLLGQLLGVKWPVWVCTLLFTSVLGAVVCFGIRAVDYVNRGLMSVKLGIFLLLVGAVLPAVSLPRLLDGDARFLARGVTVMVTSLAYANLIPSLRVYLQDDVRQLRKLIWIGSLIPLACYLLWNASVMGVIPRQGTGGLIELLHSRHAASGFVEQLSLRLASPFITLLAHGFTSICLATTFLTCSLSLSDFLKDGLKLSTPGNPARGIRCSARRYLPCAITFLPPLLVVLFYPGIFLGALSYAGLYCFILFALLPALMAWRGRYGKEGFVKAGSYRVAGGKPLLAALVATSTAGIGYGLYRALVY